MKPVKGRVLISSPANPGEGDYACGGKRRKDLGKEKTYHCVHGVPPARPR
jgi:hypothetical protein